MAIQVSGTDVINQSRELTNITAIDSSVTKIWDRVTTTSSNKTLVNREHCTALANNITITLPASPSAGWEVVVVVGGNFNNITIGRNGQNIMGIAENMIIDLAYASINFTFIDSTRGWRVG